MSGETSKVPWWVLYDGFSPEEQAKTDAKFRELGERHAREMSERFMQDFMGDDYRTPEQIQLRTGRTKANNLLVELMNIPEIRPALIEPDKRVCELRQLAVKQLAMLLLGDDWNCEMLC